jgi:hypothetical protein
MTRYFRNISAGSVLDLDMLGSVPDMVFILKPRIHID